MIRPNGPIGTFTSGPILPPVLPADDEHCPPLRHTSLLLIERRTEMTVVLGVNGRGSIRLGTDSSALSLAVEDIDAARRLHEQTGELLSQLRRQARDRASHAHLRAVPRG